MINFVVTWNSIKSFIADIFETKRLREESKSQKAEIEKLKKENAEMKKRLEKPKVVLNKHELYGEIVYIEEGNEREYYCPNCYEDNEQQTRLSCNSYESVFYCKCRKCDFNLEYDHDPSH